MKKPLYFISREKEWELIQRLLTSVDNTQFDPKDTAVLMVSPDYSATVAMHLAHAWSRDGEMLSIIPVEVAYPGEDIDQYVFKLMGQHDKELAQYKKLILVEAGIIKGGNWQWILEVLNQFGYNRDNITLVALCENIHSKIKSDYVGEYYDDNEQELTFYFERYNNHWK